MTEGRLGIDVPPILIVIGLVIAGRGISSLLLGGKIPWLGKLPGDFYYKGQEFHLLFPARHKHNHQYHPHDHHDVHQQKIISSILDITAAPKPTG